MMSKIPIGKKYFSKFWDTNFLFQSTFIPLAILTLYLVSFSYILPDGVNKVFVNKFWKLSMILTVASGLFFITLFKLKKGNKLAFIGSSEKISFLDMIFLLLPLTPLVQYILNNQDILSIWESFYVLGFFSIFCLLLLILLPSVFGFIGSTRTLMILGLALAFILINMSSLSSYFSWFGIGNFKIQVTIFSGVFFSFWFLYDLNYKKLMYVVLIIYFVSNIFAFSFTQKNNKESNKHLTTKNELVEFISNRKPLATPNIYLLVYDAYVSNETMLAHNISNGNQEEHLEKLGFKLYPSTYSVGAASIETMSRVINASTEYYGDIRKAVSGNGIVQNILKDFNYKTNGVFVSDYFFRGTFSNYDFYFPQNISPSATLLSKAILMGEFRFDLEFNKLPRKQFLETKTNLFENTSDKQNFTYMHTNLPGHSQNSGACLANETELFNERLEHANLEMNNDVDSLVINDPRAIIIAGNHGPYLTKNCTDTWPKYDVSDITRLDMQDRFGTFLAIHWPTNDFEKYDQIVVLQDLFPSIFAYMFKDEKILKAKIKPATINHEKVTSGVLINNGIIYGGVNDGEHLFTAGN